jgi:hypothetical protein
MAVLSEAGYRCGNPRCNHVITLQLHHIQWVRDGGGDEPSNLLALCAYCHELHTQGHISAEAIRLWKGLLLALNHAFDRESMDLMRFLRDTAEHKLTFSSDGVLKFARLIANGYVEIARTVQPGDIETSVSVHDIQLTEAGHELLEAWLSGDEERYQHLLSVQPGAFDAKT